ncbi:MAG: crosslink repair DNA glycosylase YcaQ family protein [Bacteroidota bacterium]
MRKNTQEIEISQKQARRIALKAQGLLGNKFYKGKRGALQAIRQLSYIQIDTISVVQRAHHHTIWSRIPDYQPEMIWTLLEKDREIFEYWSHAAAFLPVEDFRYSHWKKNQVKAMDKHWHERDHKVRKYVLDRIRSEGALRSKDFENPRGQKPDWFTWKPTKIALEQLFIEGELMITRREKFQKVFDLTERVLPKHIDHSEPTEQEMADYLIERALHAHGLVQLREINYLRKGIKASIKRRIAHKLDNGEIIQLKIKGLESDPYFTFSSNFQDKSLRILNKRLYLLNPFDNAVIQRKRLAELFNFDYQIEVYVPQAKRQFGYYSLPILWGDEFAGRIDVKADRKQKLFMIQHLWKEEGFSDESEDFYSSLKEALQAYAHFNGCENIQLNHCAHQNWKNFINSWLK